jgi:hypothetical protein
VAERETPGRVGERLRVGQAHGAELGRPPQVNQGGSRRLATHRLAARVVPERRRGSVGCERAIGGHPRSAPPEPGDPVLLEPRRHLPQVGEREWLVGPDGELLAHRRAF